MFGLEGRVHDRIRDLLITGDFFVAPPRVVLDLEAWLRGVEAGRGAQRLCSRFFANAHAGLLSVTPEDFATPSSLRSRRRAHGAERTRGAGVKFVSVVQHTSADYLGLMEDHLEGRNIRFKYFPPLHRRRDAARAL